MATGPVPTTTQPHRPRRGPTWGQLTLIGLGSFLLTLAIVWPAGLDPLTLTWTDIDFDWSNR